VGWALMAHAGVYWALMAMDLLGSRHKMKKDEIIAWVLKCYDESSGSRCFVFSMTTLSICRRFQRQCGA